MLAHAAVSTIEEPATRQSASVIPHVRVRCAMSVFEHATIRWGGDWHLYHDCETWIDELAYN